MRGRCTIRLGFCALVAFAGFIAAPVAAQAPYGYQSYQPETPAAALARHVRTLASDPKDFDALIGAGKAAIAVGDAQAAAGFFARADDVNPRSPLPQAGMGAVSVANGEPNAAMPYFVRALQLGASITQVGCDRGLAYDLLGQQQKAQADYRAALNGPDADEARRRLALSLAIGGDKASALSTLGPLTARGDSEAARARAFVLALTGDSNGAMSAFDRAMPGSWSRIAPFLQRLPSLRADQKAAAVDLGIFPDSGAPILASASAVPTSAYAANSSYGSSSYAPRNVQVTSSVTTNRLEGIDELLNAPVTSTGSAPSQPALPSWQPPAPQVQPQVAYAAPPQRQAASSTPAKRKLWLQLASGPNARSLPNEFRRIKSKSSDLFQGISGYVAQSPDRARLVIGPFRGPSDAEIFAEDLHTIGVESFTWTNSESDQIVPLGTE